MTEEQCTCDLSKIIGKCDCKEKEADENISNILARQKNKHIPESIMKEIENG